MNTKLYLMICTAMLIAVSCATHKKAAVSDETTAINLIVRADDIGFCHSANAACIDAYRNGIVRSVEIMVPCPWYPEAVDMLRENPGLDVGVHLTLNCEWQHYKWGPVTDAKTLVDENSYFYSRADQLYAQNVDFDELEQELRTQIETALRHIPQISHLSFHMGTSVGKPGYKRIVEKLSAEFNLPMYPENLTGSFESWAIPADEKETFLVNKLKSLTPGTWMFVCHPAYNTAETKAIRGENTDYDADINMAVHRGIMTQLLQSKRVQRVIEKKNIRLIGYADTYQ